MNKQIAIQLKDFAESISKRYSKTNREGNFNNETFLVKSIIPSSEHTATVIFEKNTGKQAAFFFYYINKGMSRGWKYFVPTDSHIMGFRAFEYHKLELESKNYEYNFD